MHLFSKQHLAASSGIVGASGPLAAGFALATQYLHPGAVAVSFFGEGAMNQGMLMESLNLASAWSLPVLFVCKDDGWAITTQSRKMTGGNLKKRAQGLGIPAAEVDGRNVNKVWEASHSAIEKARSGKGPSFLLASCAHLEGHFLGFQLLRMARHPLKELSSITVPLTKSILRPRGASWRERLSGLKDILAAVLATFRDSRQDSSWDPVLLARKNLISEPEQLQEIETKIEQEIGSVLDSALKGVLV
jgi:pyruvate dehydrogenase E1 component alpha subunit